MHGTSQGRTLERDRHTHAVLALIKRPKKKKKIPTHKVENGTQCKIPVDPPGYCNDCRGCGLVGLGGLLGGLPGSLGRLGWLLVDTWEGGLGGGSESD